MGFNTNRSGTELGWSQGATVGVLCFLLILVNLSFFLKKKKKSFYYFIQGDIFCWM